MPAVCNALGVHFDYPDNWELEEFEDPSGGGAAVVNSPETAFWQLTRHPADADVELLFDEALAALRAEYGEIEASAAHDQVDGIRISGYDVNFYCLDLTNTCSLRSLQTSSATFLIIAQAEDRELLRVKGVFDAMLTSLLRGLDGAH